MQSGLLEAVHHIIANTISMIMTHARFSINMYTANFTRQISKNAMPDKEVYSMIEIHVGPLDRCDHVCLCVCDGACEHVLIVLCMR